MTETEQAGTLARISERLIRVLPPAFLLLCILNAGFAFVLLQLVNANQDQRNAMLTKIVEACLTGKR
jgi:hypothetical protein